MTTKERVQAEIEHLDEEEMDELLRVIRGFAAGRVQEAQPRKPGLLSKLKQIKIEAPEDFAANLDLYTSGEKSIGSHPDVH